MIFNAQTVIGWIWAFLGVFWLIGRAFTKPTVRAQPLASRFFNVALAFLGFTMLGTPWFDVGWMALRFAPPAETVRIAGIVLTLAGAIFAIWARVTLGSNWSGRPSVKAGHELIVTGPFALTRHPIYTGLLLAVAGTALVVDQWHAVFGFSLVLIAFLTKIRLEEQFMMQAFPDSYPAYRRRVKALVPGVF